jgi:hypothetical protein
LKTHCPESPKTQIPPEVSSVFHNESKRKPKRLVLCLFCQVAYLSHIAVELVHIYTGEKMRTRDSLKRTGRRGSNVFVGVAVGSLVAFSSSHGQAAVIFSDGFGSSTLNQTLTSSNVTSSSTSYDAASNKAATANIASGDLELNYTSSSGYAEFETLFTQAPVTLSLTGATTIEADVTFKATAGAVLQVAGDYTFLGLFNSNGNVSGSPSVVPYNNLQSSGLSSSTTEATGGVRGWVGYNGQISATGGNGNYLFSRLAQTGTTQQVNQDLVIGGVGSASAQTTLGSNSGGSYVAVIGDTYTQDLTITLNASGSLTITNLLYLNTGSGSSTAGTFEEGNTSTATAASSPNLTFDGIGFGMRGATQELDYSSVMVSDNAVAIPEPASLSLLGLCGCGLLRRRARRS